MMLIGIEIMLNAANLALFMVNVAHVLLRNFRQEDSNVNVLDLKAHFRGLKYVTETLKWLPAKLGPYHARPTN